VVAQVLAFVVSMAALVGLLALLGYGAGTVVSALWSGSVGSPFALSQSLSEAVPLTITATAIWFAYQAGLFNIGADGQLQIGGLITLVVAIQMASVTSDLTIAVALLGGCLAGGFWAAIAGALRAYRGSSEVISTIMLNFIATATLLQLADGALRSPDAPFTPQTSDVPLDTQLGLLWSSVGIPWIIAIAIAVAVVVIGLVISTRLGLRLRAVGLNPEAARHAGVAIRHYQFAAFCLSGAIAGLAGGLVILGLRYYISPGWAPAWGFQGMVIAFLALRTPLLIPVWGIALGMIGAAGPALKGDAGVPDSITIVMQTLPLIVLYVFYALIRMSRAGISTRRSAVSDSSGPG
jgi:simple sugar transport system permease protein